MRSGRAATSSASLIRYTARLYANASIPVKFVSQNKPDVSTFQGLILALQSYWAEQGCVILQPYDMALGAAQAVEARGLKGKVAIYGYDGSEDALKAVKSGDLAATVDQFPGLQGRTAVKTLVTFIREGTKPDSAEVLVAPVAITADNLDQAERVGLIGE